MVIFNYHTLLRATNSIYITYNNTIHYVLKKNPQSGMFSKDLRKGFVYGLYSDDQTYCVYFKDSETEISYRPYDFEYLDSSRYN